MSRLYGRIHVFARAVPKLALQPFRRRPALPKRILLLHHMLLGDALLLTALIAKTRKRYPHASIMLACPKAIAPLYDGHPFGITALAFDPRDSASVKRVIASGPFDLGIVAGDNRYSWLARAARCKWIVAHEGGRPAWKNWPVDELTPYPENPEAWGEIAAGLVDGSNPDVYRTQDWPTPGLNQELPAELRERPYVVLHPGASTSVKRWPIENWREIARRIKSQGFQVVWTGGGGEVGLVAEIGSGSSSINLAGRLSLPALWHLFDGAHAVVCPDTGVAHLARLVGVPTVALFGPGNPTIHGAGRYWADAPFIGLVDVNQACRNQNTIFGRRVAWARRCSRNESTCLAWNNGYAACMVAHSVDTVEQALLRVAVDRQAIAHAAF